MNYLVWVRNELDTPAKKFLTVLSLLLVLGQLQRIQVTPTIAVYLHDILITSWLGYWFLFQPAEWQHFRKALFRLPKKWLIIIGLGIAGYGVSLVTDNFQLLAVLQTARLSIYLTCFWTLWRAVNLKQLPNAFTRYYVVAISGLIGWLGLLQYFLLPDTRFLAITGWDDHYFRLISTQFDPGYAGIIVILGFWALQYFHKLSQKTFLFSLFFTVVIALTYSRASYLAFAVSLVIGLVLLPIRNIRKNVLVCLVSLLLLIPFLPQPASEGTNLIRTRSVTARNQQLQDYVVGLKPYNLLVGNGLFVQPKNNIPQVNSLGDHANVANNWVVTLVTGLGGVGTLGFIWLGAKYLLTNVWTRSKLLTLQLVAVLVFGLFNNIFQPFTVLLLGLSWVGLLLKADREL